MTSTSSSSDYSINQYKNLRTGKTWCGNLYPANKFETANYLSHENRDHGANINVVVRFNVRLKRCSACGAVRV